MNLGYKGRAMKEILVLGIWEGILLGNGRRNGRKEMKQRNGRWNGRNGRNIRNEMQNNQRYG